VDNVWQPVLTKMDFARRYRLGEFGNASPTWDSLEEFRRHQGAREQLYHLRNRVAGGATYYNCTAYEVLRDWGRQADPKMWYCSEMAPTSSTILQGEVLESAEGLRLYYSHVRQPMRQALEQGGRELRDFRALMTLRHYLCQNSQEWLRVLLDRYPEHVVEFSTYSRQWGTIPGYNTVFWEVRKY
jgi:hypothetical protein